MAGAAGRGECGEADDERSARNVGLQWKSPAGQLERKARSRSDAPKTTARLPTAVSIVGSSIGALHIFTVVALLIVTDITVSIIVAVAIIIARTMVLTSIAAVTVQRRALSPVAPTGRTGMPASTTA